MVNGAAAKVADWVDSRLGLSHQLLRPIPEYAINPFYWLGALAVVAFVIQGFTGMMMMLYYVPSPMQAYASTEFVFKRVSYGSFLETVHLYTAYAMIMLAFMHMMRGYFVSVHRKPREMMWVVGMVMGFVTLGFGFTGYLLPWTVVSKSATDVGIGMLDALPQPLSSFLSFLMVGGGGDATELLRFYDLHVVVLPAALLILLVVKMYMLEVHGISEPAIGSPKPEAQKLIPVFPDVSLYLLELAAVFGVAMLLISVLFPLNLPPQYSPQAGAGYTPQPDWYFLWIYQVVKISVFEGAGLPIALSLVTVVFVALFLLPFIDGGDERNVARRPVFVTLGVIFVAEIVVLAFWGLITPGRIIPNEQAALVLGGTALAVATISLTFYKLLFRGLAVSSNAVQPTTPSFHPAPVAISGAFAVLLALGTLAIAGSFNAFAQFMVGGFTTESLGLLGYSLTGLVFVMLLTAYFLYRLDFCVQKIKRRIRVFEVGLK
jgi:quinol-cytochrome oxidoreductase complex cytochrome b subunit